MCFVGNIAGNIAGNIPSAGKTFEVIWFVLDLSRNGACEHEKLHLCGSGFHFLASCCEDCHAISGLVGSPRLHEQLSNHQLIQHSASSVLLEPNTLLHNRSFFTYINEKLITKYKF